MLQNIGSNDTKSHASLEETLHEELRETEQALEDVSRKLQQSQLEVDKLSQRNVAITSRLRKVRSGFNDTPREEIREVYDEALDAQQRLFVMRGQMEKLQSEQVHLQTYRDQLNALLEKIEAIREEKKDGKEPSALELIESVIQAQEAERQRLSRKMHDGPAQALSNFILQAEIAQRLFDRDVDQAREELEVLKDTASATFQKVRDFIFELRPMMLDDLGLVPTLRHYVEAYQEQIDLEIEFTATGTERRLERYLEVMIFRAIQELLSNASRHSQATQIRVQLDTTEQNVKATVEDNGQGFDVDRALEGSMGIKVIKDRVEMLGGHITIDAAEDQGTRISFEIPAAMVGGDVFA
jgi:two-component system sensor histidine kinase DegS